MRRDLWELLLLLGFIAVVLKVLIRIIVPLVPYAVVSGLVIAACAWLVHRKYRSW